MLTQEEDQQLVERVQRGFDLLVLKYQHKILGLIVRFVHDTHEAQDVAQEAFIKAYRALGNFRGDSAFYTWLYRIAINTAKNYLVSRGRRPPDSDVSSEDAEFYDGDHGLKDLESPERALLRDEIEGTVHRTIQQLPEDLRTALTLREFDGLSYEDIASVMQCPVGTVRSRIFRAREAIDKALQPLLQEATAKRGTAMSRDALQESLSAVMDNEADELELRRVLNAFGDAETRDTWSRYQVARAVMHKDLLIPRLDIAAAVSAALADEAVPAKAARGPWRSLGRLAVAASVTVAVLAGVRLYNQDEIAGTELAQQTQQPIMAGPQVKGPAVLAGYKESSDTTGPMANGVLQGQSGWQDQRLPGYLRQHAQESALKGTESALPYARAASLENR